MYKKLLSIILVFVLMFTMLPVTASDVKAAATIVASGNCGAEGYVYNDYGSTFGSNATWTLDSEGVLTISGTGEIKVSNFWWSSETLRHYPDNPWYDYNDTIKSVIIEEGITGNSNSFSSFSSSFDYISGLKSISIPSTFTGSFLAYGCKQLNSVTLANGIKKIPADTFGGCVSLNSIILPNTVNTIGDFAFDRCLSLETIDLSNITTIGDTAFRNCLSLKNINLSNVTFIETGAFEGCTNLVISSNRADAYAIKYAKENHINCVYPTVNDAEITLSQDLFIADKTEKKPNVTVVYKGTTLVENTDYELHYKNNVDVGTATVFITGIGKYGDEVSKTYTLKKVSINDAKVTLEPNEFTADKTEKKPAVKLTVGDVTLTEGVDYTLAYANNVDAGIGTVTITGIGKYYDTVREEKYTINGVSLENADVALKKTIYTYDGSAKTPTVVVKYNGATLTEGVDYSISYKDNQDDGTAYVLVTGMGMFVDTVSKSFVILPYNSGMDSVYEDGMLISDTGVYGITDDEKNEVELCCPSKAKVTDLKVPATITDEDGVVYTVTSIGKEAFYKNTKIQSIEIGNNVKSIEDYAFYGCKNVKSIKLGKNVELIGGSTFRKCTKLTAITLPKSVKELGKNAFYGCSKLKTITINANSVVDINENAIKNISKKAVIKVPKKLVKEYKKEFNKKSGFKNTMKIKSK